MKKLKEIGISALNLIYTLISTNLIKNAHRVGLKIYPWTVNDINLILKLKSMEIDGIITDYPDILLNRHVPKVLAV